MITDELGSPGWYSDEFERLLRKVGLPGITLSGFPAAGREVSHEA
ncbi:MAG: hypothetical protein ABR926_24105 [Streptosporangiaceae bacterium]